MSGVDQHGDVADEVADRDGAATHRGERAIAAVARRPHGAAHRGGAVATPGAVAATGAGPQGLQDRAGERLGRARPITSLLLAAGKRGRTLECVLQQRQGGEALVFAAAGLGEAE